MLDHVNVVVTDMDRSVAFYASVLGLAPVMDRLLSGDWFEHVTGIASARARCVILDAPGGGCRIELLQFTAPGGRADAPPPAARPSSIGLRHLAIRVADLDARLAALKALCGQEAAVAEVPADIVRGGKRMCYVRDPDGAIVELCEYGAERPEFR
ncbi:VOC family protein [Magnetospirillum sp. SS-4]|uniref:VOC family protein n=1 Tax=Magnetospirillum sp. SS-4 TaxID=2681465 RepID=UPI00137F9BA2|nr:VOC family protein [Magnetospirillum sp. SS-4]CAA7620262.1 Lactoylglutathione lyase [Magnetospirillum sp. SS-4]